MNTTYDKIRDKFLSLVTDFDLLSLEESEINEIVDNYMESAIARFHDCAKDIENRDDIARQFNVQLNSLEIEILANYMILSWLSPQTRHQAKLQNILGTKEYTTYSPANLLKEMREMESQVKRDVTELCNEYYYLNLLTGDK